MTTVQRILPVILSGGSGTRLWPSSRAELPKQFLPLVRGHSTFEDTLERVSSTQIFCPPLIVTGSQFEFLVAEGVRKAQMSARIVLEPLRRDSGPAIAVAAELARQERPESLLLTLAADHLVKDNLAFLKALEAGIEAAKQGKIVAFGISPTAPATVYGYIEPGKPLGEGVCEISRFIEKPDSANAEKLIKAGCLWNSGNFLFRADVLLEELARFEPEISAATIAAVNRRQTKSKGSITLEILDS